MSSIAIVYGTFHQKYVTEMLEVVRHAAAEKKVNIVAEVGVPGSYEKPIAVKRLFLNDKIDAVVVLGIIEKGETKHGLVMAETVTKALLDLELEFMKPLGMGILGPEIEPQHIASRVKPYALAAFDAALKMLE